MADKKSLQEKSKYILQGLWLETLTFLPVFIGLAIIILMVNTMGTFGFSLGAFVAGFTGVIIIFRKEIPTPLNRIQGTMAVIEGILMTVLLWGAAIFALVEGLK
jgi:hypothetical protein